MNAIKQLFNDLKSIDSLPSNCYEMAYVISTTQTLDAQALNDILKACHQVDGWVQGPSQIDELVQMPISLSTAILEGEWKQGDAHYGLSYLGLGQWQLTCTDLKASTEDEANCVVETIYQNRSNSKNSQLIYKKLWQFETINQVTAPIVTQAVFAGFKGER